jgi:hypothetical protein
MLSVSIVIPVAAVLFLSSLTRATFGFGDALFALPLLSAVIGVRASAPLVLLIGFSLSIMMLIRYWKFFRIANIWRILLAAVCGIPVGIFLLKGIDESIMKLILSFLTIGFSLYNLFNPNIRRSKHVPVVHYSLGFVSGVFGGAYNIPGPPLVMLSALSGWPPDIFRVNLQSIFLIMGPIVIFGHTVSGLLTREVALLALISFPFAFGAFFLGKFIASKLSPERFYSLVYILILLVGGFLLIRTLVTW